MACSFVVGYIEASSWCCFGWVACGCFLTQQSCLVCDGDADAGCFVGIARKGVSIDSVLSHLDQSDDDNIELKIKMKVNSNCKIMSFSLLRIKVEMASNDEANTPSYLMGLIGRRTRPSTD